MLKQQNLKTIADYVLNKTKSWFDQTEVCLGTDQSTTIRFANNLIYQSMSIANNWLRIRLIKNKKISVVTANDFSYPSINQTIANGKKLCQLQKQDKNFVSLPDSTKLKTKKINSFSQEVYNLKEQNLAKIVWPLIKLCKKNKLTASGKIEKSADQLMIKNSLGVYRYQPSTSLFFSSVVRDEKNQGSAYQEKLGQSVDQLDLKKIASQLIKTAKDSQHPKKIKPGSYQVIFMPDAFQEIMPFFAWLGPNARIYHEDVSFLKNKLGQRIFSPLLTITDQPLNKISPATFDFEGYPKKNLELIKNGTPKTIVYDSYYGQKYQKTNTGHALPAPNTEGPIPLHLNIKPGTTSLEAMIKQTKKGILVNRLWYIRVVHYKQLVLTGMTRNGTFLIENGKIKQPIQNLRFTDSIPNMFKNIKQIANQAEWKKSMWGITKIPAIKVAKFKFTS